MKKIKANFKLKEPNSSSPTLIYLKSYFNNIRFVYSTTITIHPQYWDDGVQRPITYRLEKIKDELKINPSSELRDEKKVLEGLVKQGKKEYTNFINGMDNITSKLNIIQDELDRACQYFANQGIRITPEGIKDHLDKKLGRIPKIDPEQNEFFSRFDEFIDIRKQIVGTLTTKKFLTLKSQLKEFEKRTKYEISFKSIDLVFHDMFENFLLGLENKRTKYVENNRSKSIKGLLNDTIAKYFSSLKTFMQWSLDRNYHDNRIFQNKQFSAKKKVKHKIVTLTVNELIALYNLDLSSNPKLERVRDLFCFATYTGQRWSDIENFKKEDIKDEIWVFRSHKTKKLVEVPFVGFIKPALNILKKYNYQLPKISPQRFNDYIKEVGEKAGINEIVPIERYSGNKRIQITKPKYEFMSSHMARRSCVTILLQTGVPPTTIMILTGHTDLKTLMKYENTDAGALSEALKKVELITVNNN